MRSWIEPSLIKTIREEVPLFISNVRTISDTTLIKTHNPGEYRVKINDLTFIFYQPYLSQKPINMEDHAIFTLAAAQLGHAYNWLLCRATEKYQWVGADAKDADLGVAEFKVLEKVGGSSARIRVASYWFVGWYRPWIVYLFEIASFASVFHALIPPWYCVVSRVICSKRRIKKDGILYVLGSLC